MGYSKMVKEKYRSKWKTLREVDSNARENGKLVGRYITQDVNDGEAVYVIIKETDNFVVIEFYEIGDLYISPEWGMRSTLEKEYAKKIIELRESIEAMLS